MGWYQGLIAWISMPCYGCVVVMLCGAGPLGGGILHGFSRVESELGSEDYTVLT